MTLAALIKKRKSTIDATAILATPATDSKGKTETVAKIATVAVANPLKIEKLRNLIAQLITVYGDTESDWDEYAADVISSYSHDLDSAIECFNHLHDENRSAINRKKQEGFV